MKILLALCLALSLGINARGAEKDKKSTTAAPAEEKKSDKLDLQNLEQKYWSAKDSDFQVVQNRTYTKDRRAFVSASYGVLVNDAYSYGRMTNLAAGYYFSERWGLEFAYEKGDLAKNDSTIFLKNTYGSSPNYNTFVSYQSVNFLMVPFYSKTSLWDKHIMYFDMQFGFGIGQMTYETQYDTAQKALEQNSVIGYNIDFTQQLFFSDHFALRLDIKNKFSKQDLKRYQNSVANPNADRNLGSINQQDTTILLGLTTFF